jgi:hypothetical protein
MYYGTQTSNEPPTFVIFVNDKDLVHFSYKRYLENRIRAHYPFEGTPIQLIFRSCDHGESDCRAAFVRGVWSVRSVGDSMQRLRSYSLELLLIGFLLAVVAFLRTWEGLLRSEGDETFSGQRALANVSQQLAFWPRRVTGAQASLATGGLAGRAAAQIGLGMW